MHFLLMRPKAEAEAQYIYLTEYMRLRPRDAEGILYKALTEKMEREYDEHRTRT